MRAETRLYLALTYLALGRQDGTSRQLKTLLKWDIHPRNAAQVRAALGLMGAGVLPAAVCLFVQQSLRSGWSSLGAYP